MNTARFNVEKIRRKARRMRTMAFLADLASFICMTVAALVVLMAILH